MTPEYADRHGWMLDTSSVPWLAYRGPRWAPWATCHCRPLRNGAGGVTSSYPGGAIIIERVA